MLTLRSCLLHGCCTFIWLRLIKSLSSSVSDACMRGWNGLLQAAGRRTLITVCQANLFRPGTPIYTKGYELALEAIRRLILRHDSSSDAPG